MKTLKLVFAWVWIAVPLAWGIYSSALKAAPLFQRGAAASAPASGATQQPPAR
jgi:hypothetical protein